MKVKKRRFWALVICFCFLFQGIISPIPIAEAKGSGTPKAVSKPSVKNTQPSKITQAQPVSGKQQPPVKTPSTVIDQKKGTINNTVKPGTQTLTGSVPNKKTDVTKKNKHKSHINIISPMNIATIVGCAATFGVLSSIIANDNLGSYSWDVQEQLQELQSATTDSDRLEQQTELFEALSDSDQVPKNVWEEANKIANYSNDDDFYPLPASKIANIQDSVAPPSTQSSQTPWGIIWGIIGLVVAGLGALFYFGSRKSL